MNKLNHTNTIKNDRFPSSLFLVYFLVLLLMSGIHTGIIVGMNALGWNKIIQVILPLGYWTVVAVGLTLFTKNVIRKSYEKPMHDLADATKKVAEGDFSVYVPTLHTADRLDYLEETQTEVPLGTVFAPNLFTGMGPRVKVGLAGLAQMEAQFVSAFTSAGINQTRHRILIEVHAGFRILTPFGGEDREIVSTYPVTDTVIVGTVPERYTYIGGSGSDLLGEIRDYEENSDISHEIGK